MFYFHNFIFKLRGPEHKISRLAIKEISEKLDILNKSYPLSRYKANSSKNKEKSLIYFDSDARVFDLSN